MSFFRRDKQKREGKPYLQKGGSEKKRKMGKGIAPGNMGSRQLCSFLSCVLDNQDLVLSGIQLRCCVG